MAKKLVVIGLDAADLDVMRPLIAAGRMPVIGGLMAQGASGILHSTIPPVSAPAWATFLTGREPGNHGLYAFVVERERRGRMQLANVTDIQGPKLWDLCAVQGVRPVVANVPVTWPAPPVDGVIVTGMLTPEKDGVAFTHPPALSDEIRKAIPGYRIDIDKAMMADRDHLYDRFAEMNRKHRDLFVHLLRTQPYGCFVGIFTNTDRGQHAFWRSDRHLVDRLFSEVDTHVGEVLAGVDRDETIVMLMSDHGFQGAKWKLYVNRALEDAGLLVTKRSAEPDEHYERRRPDFFEGFQGGRGGKDGAGGEGAGDGGDGVWDKMLAAVGVGGRVVVDWERTRAFLWSLDTGGVAVNTKSRYAHGSVEDADYEKTRDEIIAVLTKLRTGDGVPCFRTVRRREDAYSGPYVSLAPDVVVEPDDSVTFGMDLDAKEAVRAHKRPDGTHSPRGFIALAGPGVRKGAKIEGKIADCLPTILHALGLAIPETCDGRVLTEAFDDAFNAERPLRRIADSAGGDAAAQKPVYTKEEEEELRRSLEGLGYL